MIISRGRRRRRGKGSNSLDHEKTEKFLETVIAARYKEDKILSQANVQSHENVYECVYRESAKVTRMNNLETFIFTINYLFGLSTKEQIKMTNCRYLVPSMPFESAGTG